MASNASRRDRRICRIYDDRVPGHRGVFRRRGLHAAVESAAAHGHRRRRPRGRRKPLARAGPGYSRQAAKDIAEENLVAGDPLLLDDSDVVFGNSVGTGGRRLGVYAGRHADQCRASFRPPHSGSSVGKRGHVLRPHFRRVRFRAYASGDRGEVGPRHLPGRRPQQLDEAIPHRHFRRRCRPAIRDSAKNRICC